ncbi:MAG: class I SAM-dependent methyltransferase [Candidatus Omnitrophota bacterium]
MLFKPPKIKYTDRYSKTKYVFNKYSSILKGRVLDIGGGEGYLREYIPDYTNIDKVSTADIQLDLEKETIPFEDNSFNCVLCLDALEHLDNLHDVFDKLCRITKKWLIISLPNCQPFSFRFWRKLSSKYGLPAEKPLDRHKWYYYFGDARNFIKARSKLNNMHIIQLDSERRRLRKGTIWAVLRKKEEGN